VAFIETADGREVYFHCNSVLDDAFEHLTVGSEVRFVEEMGEKGPQATSVRRWDRASTASQQDFEINPRAHKLRITRKQRQRWQGCSTATKHRLDRDPIPCDLHPSEIFHRPRIIMPRGDIKIYWARGEYASGNMICKKDLIFVSSIAKRQANGRRGLAPSAYF
jgi:cold shock CspA family protein